MAKVLVLGDEDYARLSTLALLDSSGEAQRVLSSVVEVDDGSRFPKEASTQLPEGVVPWFVLSVVPGLPVDAKDMAVNMERLRVAVAVEEASLAIANPGLEVAGMDVRDFLGNAEARRRARHDSGMVVGMRLEVVVDSVSVGEFMRGERSDLVTLYSYERGGDGKR